jgi:putative Mg2+ transporter-C (MgtC) family protein
MNADPIRIIEAVTAGVAFLAAGAIFTSKGDVHGLTTGAGMWLAGAIGVACGAGYYVVAVVATRLAAFILAALRRLEHRLGAKGSDGDDA